MGTYCCYARSSVLALFAAVATVESSVAQTPTVVTGGGFVPGSQVLYTSNFAQVPIGNFPSGLKYVRGPMEVVLVDGVPMLRSTGPAEFIIPLSAPLPQDFTLEFELVARNSNCCAGEELAFEGSPNLNRSSGSAWVAWHHNGTGIIGGGYGYGTSTVSFSEELRGELLGQRGTIQVMMSGTQFKLYTNGRQIYNIPDLVFRRSNVLRVFLGGLDDADRAVYLARVRLAAGGGAPAAAPTALSGPTQPAAPPPSFPSAPPVTPATPPGSTATQTSASTGRVPTVISGITVTQAPAGPVVSWLGTAAAATYTVQRWKIDDPACCSNSSPASPPLTGPPWQDTPLPLAGTYVYQVTVTTSAGSASGQAQFTEIKPVGTIQPRSPVSGAPLPAPNPPPVAPASPGATGTPPAPGITPTVTLGSTGPVVSWNFVPGATSYSVMRWKIDDLNCCNSGSGRMLLGGPPWPDMPLPMGGTYVYRVIAAMPRGQIQGETQFVFGGGGGAPGPQPNPPIVALPANPPTGSITPMPPAQSTPAPRPSLPLNPSPRPGGGVPVTTGTAPAPTNLDVFGSPTSAIASWDPVPGAVGYLINRAPAGTNTWTAVTPSPITVTTGPWDLLPDRTVTYNYQVQAFQADGSFGSATMDYTTPTPRDPQYFKGTQTGAGEVRLTWVPVGPSTNKYLLSGPGLGNGILLNEVHVGMSYTVTGLPVGSHTWTVATSYQPGGILTPSSAWPTATVAVTTASGPVGRYRLIALGFKATSPSNDDILERDGKGDEVYFQAMVNATTLSTTGPGTSGAGISYFRTLTYGDAGTGNSFPGRIQAGSAAPTGGIAAGDILPAGLDLNAAPGTLLTNRFPLLLWEGVLDDKAVVVVHPTLWEDDNNPLVAATWVTLMTQEAQSGYFQSSRWDNDTAGEITGDVAMSLIHNSTVEGSKMIACQNSLVTATYFACQAHGTDRPLGIRQTFQSNLEEAGWFDQVLVLTRAGIEKELTAYGLRRGVIAVGLVERSSVLAEPHASYEFYFRIERLP